MEAQRSCAHLPVTDERSLFTLVMGQHFSVILRVCKCKAKLWIYIFYVFVSLHNFMQWYNPCCCFLREQCQNIQTLSEITWSCVCLQWTKSSQKVHCCIPILVIFPLNYLLGDSSSCRVYFHPTIAQKQSMKHLCCLKRKRTKRHRGECAFHKASAASTTGPPQSQAQGLCEWVTNAHIEVMEMSGGPQVSNYKT